MSSDKKFGRDEIINAKIDDPLFSVFQKVATHLPEAEWNEFAKQKINIKI